MNRLVVSQNPHLFTACRTPNIMGDVLIALLPAVVASVVLFGWKALALIAVSNLVAGLCEWAMCRIMKKPCTVGDLSAFVTGTLLALTVPASTELWQVGFGALVAIVVVKMLFGGIGCNIANPAITSRIVLLLCFPAVGQAVAPRFTEVLDGVSYATPLAQIKNDVAASELPSLLDMFLGNRGGAIGETCTVALLIGGVYLVARRVITWHVPVAYIATVGILTAILGQMPLYQMMGGGLVIGAIFMATDYTTSPFTPVGKLIYGVGCGLLTVLIRVYGSYPEGVSFAILLMNIVTPYINRFTARRPFGGSKK